MMNSTPWPYSVAAQPQVLIHRDFQSQNILVTEGRIRLVDFQGMRLGPLGYDLASVVFDPYVAMPSQFRDELVKRFFTGMETDLSLVDVRGMVLAAGLQRIMQALGAYGFLGHVKGKRTFLDHIPAGLGGIEGDPRCGGECGPRGNGRPLVARLHVPGGAPPGISGNAPIIIHKKPAAKPLWAWRPD